MKDLANGTSISTDKWIISQKDQNANHLEISLWRNFPSFSNILNKILKIS